MKCGQAERTIARWSGGEDIGATAAAELEAHIARCVSCKKKFAEVLPFLLRDASRVVTVEEAVGVPLRFKKPSSTRLLIFVAILVIVFGGAASAFWFVSSRLVPIEFRLYAPQARSVSIVGNFSGWGGKGLSMSDRDGDGVWTRKAYLKRGRIYTYNYLIDEERLIADPESTLRVPDGFGGESSVLRIE